MRRAKEGSVVEQGREDVAVIETIGAFTWKATFGHGEIAVKSLDDGGGDRPSILLRVASPRCTVMEPG